MFIPLAALGMAIVMACSKSSEKLEHKVLDQLGIPIDVTNKAIGNPHTSQIVNKRSMTDTVNMTLAELQAPVSDALKDQSKHKITNEQIKYEDGRELRFQRTMDKIKTLSVNLLGGLGIGLGSALFGLPGFIATAATLPILVVLANASIRGKNSHLLAMLQHFKTSQLDGTTFLKGHSALIAGILQRAVGPTYARRTSIAGMQDEVLNAKSGTMLGHLALTELGQFLHDFQTNLEYNPTDRVHNFANPLTWFRMYRYGDALRPLAANVAGAGFQALDLFTGGHLEHDVEVLKRTKGLANNNPLIFSGAIA